MFFTTAMSEAKTQKSSRIRLSKRTWEILFGVSFVLVFYVLSWGPAYRLLRKGHLKQGTFSAIYYPIISVRTHCHGIDMAFYKYDELWYSDFREMGDYLDSLK